MKLRLSAVVRACLGSLTALVLLFGGCDADPMPSPGNINRVKVILSTSINSRSVSVDHVGVIGLPKAASGAGIVVVRGPSGMTEAPATAAGTFAGIVPGNEGDTLTLTFKASATSPEGPAITVTVPAPGQNAQDANTATGSVTGTSPAAPVVSTNGGAADAGDAGPDSGFPTTDAGSPAVDGGASPVDAGTAPTDGGTAPTDGGAGNTPTDGGTLVVPGDGGTPNSGSTPTISASAVTSGATQITGSGFVSMDLVIVGDDVSGAVVTLTVASDGTIAGSLATATGDTLVVVVQDQSGATSSTTELTVP